MNKRKEIIKVPMKGMFDETINVGDRVFFLTTSWHQPHVRKGTYLGYIKSGWDGTENRAKVSFEYEKTSYTNPDKTKFVDWDKYYRDYSEYFMERNKALDFEEWLAMNNITKSVSIETAITTLQLNRMFKGA